jgi:hypothetical protein
VSADIVYRRAEVLWRRTYDRVVILVPGSGELVALQASAAHLWERLEQPGSLRELAEQLATIYDASAEQIVSDMEPVLDELRRRGVVAVSCRTG